MRLTLIQATIAMVLCGMAVAHGNYAQGLLDKEVSASYKAASLKEIITDLEQKTSARFVYSASLLSISDTISISVHDKTLGTFLGDLLKPRNIAFEAEGDFILLTQSVQSNPDTPLEVIVVSKRYLLSGVVTDKDNSPLPGVSILIKGTSTGTSTDADGKYLIEVNEGDVLVFSSISFKSQEIKIGNQTQINVTMESDVATLQEVEVRSGLYYETTSATSTGNIEKVSAKDISKQPVVNPLQALQGRMAGVSIVQGSGVPGNALQIEIRGRNSIRDLPGAANGNLPLYVIDGVPISSAPIPSYGLMFFNGTDPLNGLNSENIESIQIMKDADATAMFGSKGANGVVLITTKRAKDQQGVTNLEVSFYSGVGKSNQLKGLMNSRQYLKMRRQAFLNDEVTPDESNAPDLTVWDTTRQTNWQEKMFGGSAHINDAQLTLLGGNNHTSFRIGTGYHSESTVFPGDFGYQRLSGSISINHSSKDNKFRADFTTNYGFDDNNQMNSSHFMGFGIGLAPVAPKLRKEDGSLNWEIYDGAATWMNPLAQAERKTRIKNHNLLANTVLQYDLFKFLTLKSSFGFSRATGDEVNTVPLTSFAPNDPLALRSTRVGTTSNSSWIIEPQLVFRQNIDKLKIDVVAGSSFQSTTARVLVIRGTGYSSDDLLGDLSSATTLNRTASGTTEYKYMAGFGRISLNWADKYLLNLTGRRDGSSRFGPNNKFANFGAIGAGWVFTEEKFIKDYAERSRSISFGKLRASYGTAGNDAIGDYKFLDTYAATPYTYQGISGLYPFELSNPYYAWELVKKLEVGLELGFLNDRISTNVSWYRNRSSNQLVGEALPSIVGFPLVTANSPATVQNTGVELVINTINVQSGKWGWMTSFNISIPRNKLISYPGLAGSGFEYKYKIGKPLSIANVYRYIGVNPASGVYEVEDVNGDGKFDDEDKVETIDRSRKFFGGINNTISYSGFELSFLFEFVRQTGWDQQFIINSVPGYLKPGVSDSYTLANQFAYILDEVWQQPGDNTSLQKFTQKPNAGFGYAVASDYAFTDASFFRLKSVQLNYSLPKKLVTKLGMQQCRIFLQGQNLLTFTKYKGLDPQSISDLSNLPALKMITGGVQLKF